MNCSPTSLLDASCRVALAAFLHDLGKFAERARIEVDTDALDAHKTLYCPWRAKDASGKFGWHTHVHAAYTALAFDRIERHAPRLIHGDMAPFVNRLELDASASAPGKSTSVDSLVNAAAAHHQPDTFLQWVIATADRVASGFEREEFDAYNQARDENPKASSGSNHYQARLLSLFEQIRLDDSTVASSAAELKWRYPLRSLTPDSVFPQPRTQCEPSDKTSAQIEYARLWEQFLLALEAIPTSHRSQWSLWLDHFDTAWLTFTQAIPAATAFGTRPEVSLYDHSKATAALAVALWRWHEDNGQDDAQAALRLKERRDWEERKFLLVQGDFFGIQEFIFADGSQTRKNAARLLRGRSFQVSLFTELAALKVLEALDLPPISQINNAAGKFLIVAPNTHTVRIQLERVRAELNQWFLEHAFGLAGIGLAVKAASCNDFLDKKPTHRFGALMDALFADLERAKLQRFDLTGFTPIAFEVDYSHGVCAYNDRLPADGTSGEHASASLSRDQIAIGKGLSRQNRLLVLRQTDALTSGTGALRLEVPIFGYTVAFTAHEDSSGRFGNLAHEGSLARCWDFSLPQNLADNLWHGYARRYINAYVPRFTSTDLQTQAKYKGLEDMIDLATVEHGGGKTLNHIACEDRQPRDENIDSPATWQGQAALMTLKGDVDSLGQIFQQGLQSPTFAKIAALSRQMNAFFALYLPALCATEFANVYTVFAGGDDFFLIGPWRTTQRLAARMAQDFQRYVAGNSRITFSAGMVMSKPGLPMHTLAAQAEQALEAAKARDAEPSQQKNAVVVHGERVRWPEWPKVQAMQERLDELRERYALSTSYTYGLLQLIDLASNSGNPEHAMWRSRFAYRTRRYVVDKIRDKAARTAAQTELAEALGEQGLGQLGTKFRIPLFNHFYRQR